MIGYATNTVQFDLIEGKTRAELIEEYTSKVRLIASMVAAKLAVPIEFNELVNAGLVGLLDAIDKFDPTRNNKFTTYAEFRIRGAILDSLRGLDLLTRTAREKSNQVKRVVKRLQKQYGREPSSQEVAAAMDLSLEDYYELLDEVKAVMVFSLDASPPGRDGEGRSLAETLADSASMDALTALSEADFRRALKEAIRGLPDRLKQIVMLYYYKELNFKEIGKVLELSESRISQLHSEALMRLRSRVEAMAGN